MRFKIYFVPKLISRQNDFLHTLSANSDPLLKTLLGSKILRISDSVNWIVQWTTWIRKPRQCTTFWLVYEWVIAQKVTSVLLSFAFFGLFYDVDCFQHIPGNYFGQFPTFIFDCYLFVIGKEILWSKEKCYVLFSLLFSFFRIIAVERESFLIAESIIKKILGRQRLFQNPDQSISV